MNEPKKNFIFGLVTGIAILAIIGFFAILVVYLGQDKEALVDARPSVASNNANTNTRPSAPTPSAKVDVKVGKEDNFRGKANAPVTIVEFSDFQCPYCSKFHDTMKEVMANYPNDVKWVYKHFPLDSIHLYARKAAEASECAGDQDNFWEYTDELFDNQTKISPAYLEEAAGDIGLNTSDFKECLDSGKYSDKVAKDYAEGRQLGVSGTPGNFVNGQPLSGAQPYENVKAAIDSLLQ